jgi:phosphoadenosine phosphosulfate reductase
MLGRPAPREARLQTLLPAEELARRNLAFESADPGEIVRWALEDSGLDRIAIASAFQAEGTVVMHLATQIRPDIPILFLETGFQFAETLAFKEQLTERLALNVVDIVGHQTVAEQETTHGPRLYERDPERCCDMNKVRPMFETLRGLDAWMTAVRRDSSPTRATSPFVDQYELEPGRWIVKINPMAATTRRDTWRYLKDHGLPHNPLYDLGYASIGCAPCTRVQFAGEPERAGRWAGKPKWECGIHENEAAQVVVVPPAS